MYYNKYIIFLLFFIILFCLITLINYYKTQIILKKIIEEWKNKTGDGYIKIDNHENNEGHYYLSLSNFDNWDSHIHLITNCILGNLYYIVKKDNKHSQMYTIDKNKNINNIVNEMIENYNNFE